MNIRWMLCMAALSCGLQVGRADILDDVGIAPEDFRRADPTPFRSTSGSLFAGLTLSEAHAAEIGRELGNLEDRGHIEKALATAEGLEKVRLLVRAGRPAEASAAFTDGMVAKLSELEKQQALETLRRNCRPLEDAGSWDALKAFLATFEGKLGTPAWKLAIWAEQLDVAWHLDQVPQLLAETQAKDPLKLCAMHARLGNTRESETRIAPLAAQADPARLLEMMEILPASTVLETAGSNLWKRTDLPEEQRQRLSKLLDGMLPADGFESLLGDWISTGGDIAPFAAGLWERWIGSLQENPPRKAILEKLVQRWPDEPRFAVLLGRFLYEVQPERAVALFEKAARGPFVQVPQLDPYQWHFDNLRSIPRGAVVDPTFVALGGLGMMHRQDRIQALLAARQDFATLPEIDRVRYLSAAGMDHEFVRTVLAADLSKAENAVLPELLVRILKERSQERVIPPEVLAAIGKKFPDLVLAGFASKDHRSGMGARDLFEVLVENKADPALLKEATTRLMEEVRTRFPDRERTLGFWLRTVSNRAPGYQDTVPPERAEVQAPKVEQTPEYQEQVKALNKAMAFQRVLQLLPLPEIRRIGSGFPDTIQARSRMQSTSRGRPNPLAGLDRWEMGASDQMPPVNAAMLAQVMRALGKDHPRRVPAEIMITAGLLPCQDEALKSEAAASVQALMEGKKEARGTEVFRFSRLVQEGRDPAALLPVLEDVIKLPPTLQRAFLWSLATQGRPAQAPPELVYQFIVNPAAAKADGFREDGAEARLVAMVAAVQAVGELGLELAEKVLDRQLVKAASQRNLGMPGGGGFDPRRRAMRGGEAEQGQGAGKAAVEVLRQQGKFEAWRERATSKLEIFGMPSLQIKRWLAGLEGNEAPAMPFPAAAGTSVPDPQRAAVLLGEALRKQDPDQIIIVFRDISNGRPELIADSSYLDALGPTRAAALLEAIMAAPIVGRGPDMHQAGLLHGYFLKADPALAATLRDWFAGQVKWQFRKEAGPVIADQLAEAGAKDAAVEVILKPLILPSNRSGEPWAFPLKQSNKVRPPESNRDAVVYEKDLEVLTKWKLLDAAAKRAQELGDIAPLEVAVLKMAAKPTVKTFETEALPLLAELDSMIRSNLVSRWENTFKQQPDASELVIRLLEEGSYRFKNDPSSVGYAIREASQYPGSSATIGRLWQRIATELKEGERKDEAVKGARRIVAAMALAADDETWKNYWTWRSSDPEPIGDLDDLPLSGGMEEAVPPERARQVMTRSVKEIDLIGDPDEAFAWVATVLATGDQELLKGISEKITGDAPEVMAFCSQAMGRPADVFPLLQAVRLPDGEVGLSWNLVTYDSREPDPEVRDLPLAKVPAMDGKFDLEILAGKEAGKLEVLQQVPAAPDQKDLKLKVPEGVKFFALRFTARGSRRPLETTPIQVEENRGLLPLPAEPELIAKGMARKREMGPGGLPAYQIHLGHHGEVEVANLPWTVGESYRFEAWISGGGVLQVEFLDAKDIPIERREERPMDLFRMAWQKRGLTVQANNIPPDTARLRFAYHGTGPFEGAHYFSVSGARILREKP